MHRAYRVSRIAKAKYVEIVAQSPDDGSLAIAMVGDVAGTYWLRLFKPSPFPADTFEESTRKDLADILTTTSRKYLTLVSSTGKVVVTETTSSKLSSACSSSADWKSNTVEAAEISLSIWPVLEYRQLYSDAWRMLRDYFYDPNLHNAPWSDVHGRYLPLVSRCTKRENLDDVMGLMGAELGALHLFVLDGEYNGPVKPPLAPASLGATLVRELKWQGYRVTEIPEPDPDFDTLDETPLYSPLSDKSLRLTGQRGLRVGDVIVSVNGEKVVSLPDLNMIIRGMAGQSMRLGILRNPTEISEAEEETAVVVAITPGAAGDLRYNAWEWKTYKLANKLASEQGFSVGYIHVRAMDKEGEDAFARGYFPAFDKDGLIIDVRHNSGGNIDSWILSTLQRKAWMYFAGRKDHRYGDMDWNQQFAYRGKIVVLVDENTSSDGEGFARGFSELGLGVTIGTRTWGGGIWGASINRTLNVACLIGFVPLNPFFCSTHLQA